MLVFVKIYFLILPIFVLIDLLWIGVVMKDFYRTQLGQLMSGTIAWPAAIVFYLLFAAGLVFFAALPGIASGSLVRTILMCIAFGLVAYGTYDLTNHATLRDWPLVVTVIDMAWGTFVSGLLGAVAFFLHRFLA